MYQQSQQLHHLISLKLKNATRTEIVEKRLNGVDQYSTPFKLKPCPWPYVLFVLNRAAIEDFVPAPRHGAALLEFSTSVFTTGSFPTRPVLSSGNRLVLYMWSLQRAEVPICIIVLHSDVLVMSRRYLS